MAIKIQENIPLAPLTTIQLGGPARYFVECRSTEEVIEALDFAAKNKLEIHILGGGSNTVFSDEGFSGLVLKIGLKGISVEEKGSEVLVKVAAGENWDEFVQFCIKRGLTGVECLSGIPGLVGATPIQNVGAYGQEVKDTILKVRALNRETMQVVEFNNQECQFSYRQSRFKKGDKGKYIILAVVYRLKKNTKPIIKYKELQNYLQANTSLEMVRLAVLALRRKKSMLVDKTDPNSRSVGSFFINPIIEKSEFLELKKRWQESGGGSEIPNFKVAEKIKLSAAWLIEHSGFYKGYKKNGVGISTNHALALVNYGGGSAKELLSLASEIEKAVYNRFGIRLEREPECVFFK